MNDVVLAKKQTIEKCIKQIRAYYQEAPEFDRDYLHQDAIAINLQRAMESAIDLANHVVRQKRLGLPKESREGFQLLIQAQIIPETLGQTLQGMVGFRNTLVHDYQAVNLDIFRKVIEVHLDDLLEFSDILLEIDL